MNRFFLHSVSPWKSDCTLMFSMDSLTCMVECDPIIRSNDWIQLGHAAIVFRDLKPENILMTDSGHIKITDYGLALENMHGDRTATSFAGTMGYMAPEIQDMKEYNAGVDWYSFGAILKEMLTSECNYHPTLFEDSSSGAKDIIEQLLQEDPVQRLGVSGNIREYPFFQRIDWVSVESLRMAPPYIPVVRKCTELSHGSE
ncbi:protein kinase C delta type-like [Phyllobates terribilis]|uniref:protein kinase C delta type-like n=1 Tax=Phyllobates terribilis TaxID=111132 RepID=UPI003CCAF79C